MTPELSRDAFEAEPSGPQYSVCTLITDATAYRRMLDSFMTHGFTGRRTEFLHIDNRNGNVCDAYTGVRRFARAARGRHVIICHQDVELIDDGVEELTALLAELSAAHPRWAVAGNAGAVAGRRPRRISDPSGKDQNVGPFPAEVDALDENFLILRGDADLRPCAALAGFHHYGADLCIQARVQGMSAHVIDFHLRHHSQGRMDRAYLDSAEALERHYAAAFAARRVETPNRPLYLGPSGPARLLAKLHAWNRRRKLERRGWR